MKKKIITLAGKPGSGKSSAAKGIAKALGYERTSVGDFMRELAQQRGVSITELNVMAVTDESIDKELDAANIALNDRSELVVDGRLSYHFVPDSFKVFLDLDLSISAERIFNDQTADRHASGEVVASAKELQQLLEKRLSAERIRYKEWYNVETADLSAFDLLIDTSKYPLDTVVDIIVTDYKKWLAD